MPEVYSNVCASEILANAWKQAGNDPEKQSDVILAAVKCVFASRQFYKYKTWQTAEALMVVRKAAMLLKAGMKESAARIAEREYDKRELLTTDTGPRYAAIMLLRMFFAEERTLPATLEAGLHCCLWQLPKWKRDRLAQRMQRLADRFQG